MAFIKEYTLDNGLEAKNAYHVVVKVDTVKRVVDDPDPGNIRPHGSPFYVWKAGYYGKIAVAIYASKEARENGAYPIGMRAVYPTGIPYGYVGKVETIEEFNFEMDLNCTLSDIAQAYAYLKTTSYYSDAIEDL